MIPIWLSISWIFFDFCPHQTKFFLNIELIHFSLVIRVSKWLVIYFVFINMNFVKWKTIGKRFNMQKIMYIYWACSRQFMIDKIYQLSINNYQSPKRTVLFRFGFGSVRLNFWEVGSGSVRFEWIFEKSVRFDRLFQDPVRVRFGSSRTKANRLNSVRVNKNKWKQAVL